MTTRAVLVPLLMAAAALGQERGLHRRYTFLSEKEAQDSPARQGRFFYFGNGTAMVNTTTVAVTTSFLTIMGLGVMSVLSDAANQKAAAAATTTTAKPQQEEEEYLKYLEEVDQYERDYKEYLRQYAVWAEENGYSPVPTEKRKRR